VPSSFPESIPYLIQFIRKNRPDFKSVLDVGLGFGKGGFLLREYFDVSQYQRFQPQDWKIKIVGVEIFKDYISDLQKMIYNKIIIGDIFKVLPNLGKFDIALLNDIIEHFPKEGGLRLIKEVFNHADDIFITTPYGFFEHPARGKNKHEEHKSGWKIEDLKEFRIIDKVLIPRIFNKEEILMAYLRK